MRLTRQLRPHWGVGSEVGWSRPKHPQLGCCLCAVDSNSITAVEFVLLISVFSFLTGKSPPVPFLIQSYIKGPALLPCFGAIQRQMVSFHFWPFCTQKLAHTSNWAFQWRLASVQLNARRNSYFDHFTEIILSVSVLVILNSRIFLLPLVTVISPHNSCILTVTTKISKCSSWVLFCALLSLHGLLSMILIL